MPRNPPPPSIRDRIVELRRVPANTIAPSPHNWRLHPAKQSEALQTVLDTLGFAGAILVRIRDDESLEAIDGHLRISLLGKRIVPALVTDLSASEAKLLLATFDPISAMAGTDQAQLDALLAEVRADHPALDTLLEDLASADARTPDDEEPAIPESYAVYLECESEREQHTIIAELLRNNLSPRALTVPKIERKTGTAKKRSIKAGTVIKRICTIDRTPRVVQVEGIFDLTPAKAAERTWTIDCKLDRPWQIGLIVGPSGSGKSTIAEHLFGKHLVRGWDWPAGKALVDGFPESLEASEITTLLSSVGLSSPPSWIKPFAVLSNGEQFRANLARTLAEMTDLAVVDEFTSVVDRTVAKIGSAAVAKCIRGSSRQFVAVTCHYDVEEWLQPDWTYDVSKNTLTWGLVRRRPDIHLQLQPASKRHWPQFAHHHYLNGDLHAAARCFLATVDGQPAAFVAVLHSPGRTSFWREHRCVCLPDFQGVGIGNAVSEYVASLYVVTSKPYRSTTSHPSMISHRHRSPLWRTTRAPSMTGVDGGKLARKTVGNASSRAFNRLTASFEFIGPPRPEAARDFGVLR